MRCALMLLVAAIYVWSLSGCATPTPRPNGSLEGRWLVELSARDIGRARCIMEFETDTTAFTAHTRKGADRELLGWWTSFLGRTFTSNFPKGYLLRVEQGKTELVRDTLKLSGIFRSSLGNYYFNGFVLHDSLQAVLTARNGSVYGRITAARYAGSGPLENYPAIVSAADSVARTLLYNPTLTSTTQWTDFERNMHEVSQRCMDDVEMVFAWYYYSRKLSFSHFALLKPEPQTSSAVKNSLSLEALTKKTALMRIPSFAGSAREVDSLFDNVSSHSYDTLIVDLRDNPGGSIAAGMAFAKNVADTTFYGGVFLTRSWFATHTGLPSVDELQHFAIIDSSSYPLLIAGIHRYEGLCLKVVPCAHPFRGQLIILTNHNTASTCEPIVYGLKHRHRATIIGEKSAGAMLNAEYLDIRNGFQLVLPTADYYAVDGYHIDQHGVEPDIPVAGEQALDVAMKHSVR